MIGPDGKILNRHRKLMPANPERMVWGFGDGSGLKVVGTPCGRIGVLICWENFMPLARYALYGGGIEIYIAPPYDSGDAWIGTLQHVAREGCCSVVGSGCALRARDFSDDFPDRATLYPDPDEWVNARDSVVIEPGGKIIAGPMRKEIGILYAELDTERVKAARRSLDVVGHYARPDIFQLRVNTQPQAPSSWSERQGVRSKRPIRRPSQSLRSIGVLYGKQGDIGRHFVRAVILRGGRHLLGRSRCRGGPQAGADSAGGLQKGTSGSHALLLSNSGELPVGLATRRRATVVAAYHTKFANDDPRESPSSRVAS